MAIDIPFLWDIGKMFVPKGVRPGLRAYMQKAGYQEVPYNLFGIFFFILLVVFYFIFVIFVMPAVRGSAVGLSFIYYFFSAAGILLLLAAFLMLVLHFYLNIKIYERTKELERILPEYLTLVSTNLKGGTSFEQALWDAIKPEFGILANEMGLISKQVMTGNDVTEALNEFIMKYDSPILRRNFQLITSEFEAGGKIVKVIDKVIGNLKKTQILKKELAASTTTYMIFIGALITVICPALFALSYQLFFLITSFMGQLAGTATPVQGALNIAAPHVKPSDFRIFSILAIIVISCGSSCIISIIEKGDIKGFLRYIWLFLLVSMIVYFIASAALGGVFSSISSFT